MKKIQCKTCGTYTEVKRKNQANCSECSGLTAFEKRSLKKFKAIKLALRYHGSPDIKVELIDYDLLEFSRNGVKAIIFSKRIDFAHFDDKFKNQNKGLGDKRARNNPADIIDKWEYKDFMLEIIKTVPLPQAIHQAIDDGRKHSLGTIERCSGLSREIIYIFSDVTRFLFNKTS